MRIDPIDRLLLIPLNRFMSNSTTGGIVLFICAVVALILANSPLQEAYHHFWEDNTFSIGFGDYIISKSLHHWVNDGLMSIFFFVVGLELKREIIAGELSRPKDALLPIFAAIGGMVFPALLYLSFNSSGEAANGWGIPMATDIAFALGILYLLGDKVPLSLKVFLTALAIVDDIGAVLVIAFFYTSDISTFNLLLGGGFFAVLLIANRLGVRSVLFYGIVGIGGLWTAFLLSGVHATIAGVICAFAIPADIKLKNKNFVKEMNSLTNEFEEITPEKSTMLSDHQLHIIEKIRTYSKAAMTPLQRLEHSMHPLVAFIVMPVFALANAGITFTGDFSDNLLSNVSLGVISGLVLGKLIGIVLFSKIIISLKFASLPTGLTWRHIIGVALIAGVGFTMSLFIVDLAFDTKEFFIEAKMGIFVASIISGVLGFFILKTTKVKTIKTQV